VIGFQNDELIPDSFSMVSLDVVVIESTFSLNLLEPSDNSTKE
jgi:hypothetical protein